MTASRLQSLHHCFDSAQSQIGMDVHASCCFTLRLLTGEGMIDLYSSMQPILDRCRDRRRELHALKEEDLEADAQLNRISIAVVGVPNAVSTRP